MRVAVTGGSGFIGAHVVDRLIAEGHDVEVIDRRAPAWPDVRHWAVDLGDLDGLVRATAGVDVVFHLAAVADVNDAAAAPVHATDVNVAGTARVWEACRVNGVRRAILASTVWVYSGADDRSADAGGRLDEAASFRLEAAGHLYTSSKLAAELVVQSYQTLYGQDFTILRYGIPFGPGMRDSLVISRFVRMALDGDPITIQGDGSQYRNYIYVEDLADAHVRALRDEAAGEVFNLEGPEPVSIRYLVESIERLLGRPLAVEYLPARTGDYEGRAISNEKAERLLGWSPQVSFEEGLHRYLDWYRDRRATAPAASGPLPGTPPGPTPPGAPPAPPAGEQEPARRPEPVGVALPLGSLAAVAVAIAVLPFLTTSGSASLWARLLALAGSGAAVATAWFVSRRRAIAIPSLVSSAVLLVAIWLLAQASPGAVLVPLGVLIGLAAGTLSPVPLRFDRARAGVVLAGAIALEVVAHLDRRALFWSAAVLAAVASVERLPVRPRERAGPIRRPSWATLAGTCVLTAITASWAGATSPSAAWFGSVVEHGPRNAQEVALTFDGSSGVGATQRVLAILRADHVHATFFENGQTVAAQPALARAIAAGGHLLANRSWNDSGADWLDPRYRELRKAQLAFAHGVGLCPTYFRPPHGRHTPLMARVAHGQRMTMVTWDVRAGDNGDADPNALAAHILSQVRPGSIVALDLSGAGDAAADPLVRALPLVLDGLRDRRLRPVRLDTLLDTGGYTGC